MRGQATPYVSRMLKTNPFLHVDAERIYDPLTDRALVPGDGAYERFRDFETRGTSDFESRGTSDFGSRGTSGVESRRTGDASLGRRGRAAPAPAGRAAPATSGRAAPAASSRAVRATHRWRVRGGFPARGTISPAVITSRSSRWRRSPPATRSATSAPSPSLRARTTR